MDRIWQSEVLRVKVSSLYTSFLSFFLHKDSPDVSNEYSL